MYHRIDFTSVCDEAPFFTVPNDPYVFNGKFLYLEIHGYHPISHRIFTREYIWTVFSPEDSGHNKGLPDPVPRPYICIVPRSRWSKRNWGGANQAKVSLQGSWMMDVWDTPSQTRKSYFITITGCVSGTTNLKNVQTKLRNSWGSVLYFICILALSSERE